METNEKDFIESISQENSNSYTDVQPIEELQSIAKKDKPVETKTSRRNYNQSSSCKSRSTYSEFEGSYAQEVMGYSDETINDAFEGDPDAYWNID